MATALSWPHEPSERGQSERTSAAHTWTNKTALVLFSQLVFKDMLENFYCSHTDVPTVGTSQRPKTVLLSKYNTFNSLSEIVSWSNVDCAASHMAWGRPEASSIQRTLSQERPVLPSPQLSRGSQHMSFHKMAELSLPLC